MKNDNDDGNRDWDLDMIIYSVLIISVLFAPFGILVVNPIVTNVISEHYYDSLLASKDRQWDVLNGETVFIDYGLREGTYKLKPLEEYGSYIQMYPPFDDFVAYDDMLRLCLFFAEHDSTWSNGLVGLYVYGNWGIHVGKWVLGDIEYNPDAQPTVTVTLTENDTLRYDFVVPAPEYITIGNLTVDEMRKYMGEK